MAYKRNVRALGERSLMLAVLADAINCYQKYASELHPRSRALFCEAAEWIRSPDRNSPFSFENICEVLQVESDYIRRGLHKWKERRGRDRVALLSLPDLLNKKARAAALVP